MKINVYDSFKKDLLNSFTYPELQLMATNLGLNSNQPKNVLATEIATINSKKISVAHMDPSDDEDSDGEPSSDANSSDNSLDNSSDENEESSEEDESSTRQNKRMVDNFLNSNNYSGVFLIPPTRRNAEYAGIYELAELNDDRQNLLSGFPNYTIYTTHVPDPTNDHFVPRKDEDVPEELVIDELYGDADFIRDVIETSREREYNEYEFEEPDYYEMAREMARRRG